MADSKTFSLRIVSLDYYMASPIPGLDISYSSFHGGKVNEVPVIRIYGSTPAGQKTCLHIHRVLPYLYVPCADIPIPSQDEGDACTHKISLAVEKALQLKSKASSKRQYVHGCSLVRGKRFYGYHSSEELFVQIYLYYPHDVSRAANILLSGGVLGKCLQPHEAHIPFILQFLVDYNLYGMGHVHLSKVKFRHAVPDVFSPTKSVHTEQSRQEKDPNSQADISDGSPFHSPVWISSTIPVDWKPGINSMKRQSLCHLEGDATADEILNQQSKTYASLSQTRSDVKMVQSLVPIWEEEYERTGMQEIELPSDPSKPLPEDVLKTLTTNPEFFIRLNELHNEVKSPLCLTRSDKDTRPVQLMVSVERERNLVALDHVSPNAGPELECIKETGIPGSVPSREEDGIISSTEGVSNANFLCSEKLGMSQINERLDEKAADKEALCLLKWLASSQAEDDINSDDELLRETILSPFLPTNTIEEVLERANMNYESESQKECQEILDSIQDFIASKNEKERDNLSANENSRGISYQKLIPQVDGMENDLDFTPDRSIEFFSKVERKKIDDPGEHPVLEDSLEIKEVEDAHSSFTYKHKRKKMSWCPLPLSTNQILVNEQEPIGFCTKTQGSLSASNVGHESSSMKNNKETAPLVECSVRDLMRRKRKHRVESVQCSSNEVEKIPSEMTQKEDTIIFARHLNFEMFHLDGTNKMPHQFIGFYPPLTSSQPMLHGVHDSNSTDVDPLLDEKDPILSRSKSSLNGGSPGVGTENFIASGNSNSHIRSLLSDPRSPGSAATIVHCKSGQEPDVQLFKSDHGDKTSDKGLHPTNVAALSSFQNAVRNEELGGESGSTGQSSREWTHETFSKNPQSTNTNRTMDVTNLNSGQYQEREAPPIETNPQDKDLISLPFCKKVTTSDRIDTTSTRASSCPNNSYPRSDKEIYNGASEGRACDDFPPFFMDDRQKGTYCENKGLDVSDFTLQQDDTVGIPTVYQNDGSYLYLLSPIVSPPTAENVKKWLSTGTSAKGIKVSTKSSAENGTCSTLIGSPSSSPNDCNKVSPESSSICHRQHIEPPESQENCDNISSPRNVSCNKDTLTMRREGDSARVKAYSDCSQDISQISGPAGKSKLTPLSQTGFRDPASVGGGQQLTLLSIEIQAASRGDLRPDPRFDAINIVTLFVQNDSDFDVDVHVLLHGEAEDSHRNLDGISGCNVLIFCEEKSLFDHFIKFICSLDPDILLGWDVQGGSLGFLAERASILGVGLLNSISRTPPETKMTAGDAESPGKTSNDIFPDPVILEDTIISDEWGRTHASGVHVGGRIVLNVWRLMRGELNLNMYTIEAVVDSVLRRKIPCIPYKILTKWFSSGRAQARYRCIEYVKNKASLNLELVNQLDMINRTSELARVFGIDFFSVLSRGSQYRVESMYLRLAHTQNYLAISPGNHQVASQPAMECLPLVMEPESRFYADPVVVLDFQSLYPSMIIAYNLCYSTCLGNIAPSKENVLGITTFSLDPHILKELKDQILLTPNGVMYVRSKVRKGVLPRLLEEILSTRIMVKQAMKKSSPSQQVLHRILNARQLALKLIANVTYGYTAAGFSGRMPCAELADSIVQCGRRTLEKAISFVNSQEKWKAKVIYGDTDSMFVLLKGRSIEDAFRIGNEIASEITAMNPNPVVLKMEKVYYPCVLLTKKRYVGYSYESPKQVKPVFDAKGIETVRRDSCRAVSKMMEQSLRIFFEHQNIPEVKEYLQRQWKRILSGRVSIQDFVFAKEVRLGTYSTRDSSYLPPAAIVATKAMRTDPRAEPRYGDRIPYVVVHGQPGARLVDMVVDPLELLAVGSPYRLNDFYYITKQIIPALQRVFGLVGADLNKWFLEMPRTVREAFAKRPISASNPQRTRIDFYYLSKHCMLCGELVEASTYLCKQCSQNETAAVIAVVGRTSKLEREMQHLAAICRHCGGGDWLVESGVKCNSLACAVFYERCKVQKELQGLATVARDKDLYPKCIVEWF